MKPKKSPKPSEQDNAWQKKIKTRLSTEKVGLAHPRGKERFESVVKRMGKKKK